MEFNRHPELKDRHAFLSASKPSWLNYSPERLIEVYRNSQAAMQGTILHDLAKRLIDVGQELPDTTQTLNMYVNDAIRLRLKTEVALAYGEYAFGTADAINYFDNTLWIFDLKTGTREAKEAQLKIYAAYFCLEYRLNPYKIHFVLRFYQNDDVIEFDTDPEEIAIIMEHTKECHKIIHDVEEV